MPEISPVIVAELSPARMIPSIELDLNVGVNNPEGAELKPSLWVELSFSGSTSILKSSVKYWGRTWEIESSGPSDARLPCEECDSASDIILERKVEGLKSTRSE